MASESITAAQDRIVAEFQDMGDALSQYELLLEYAATLPKLAPNQQVDDNLVKGCQSQVWLVLGAENGTLSLAADSDTLIIRGILHLLIEVLDGQPLADAAEADLYFLEQADLMATFNDTRRKGIGSAIAKIQGFARDHA